MFRNGLAFAIAAAFGALSLTGCGDEIKSNNPGGTGGSSGSGGGGNLDGAISPSGCSGQCCPMAAECYMDSSGANAQGAECLAKPNITGQPNDPSGITQFRQTWIRATTPLGNTSSTVYNILSTQSALPWDACNMSNGQSGYIQAIDMDVSKGEARIGFTKWVTKDQVQAAATGGLQLIAGTFPPAGDPNEQWALPESEMSPSADYPPGLPHPMARATTPWTFGPSKAKMVTTDFDVSDDATRRSMLAKLDTGGEYADYDAVFYYDKTTGYSHGYAPLSFVIVYALTPTAYIAIPIREVETKGTVNDPLHPDCMGVYKGDVLKDTNSCLPSTTDPTAPDYYAWGCKTSTQNGSCSGGAGTGPYTTKAYFLITELEQVYSSLLMQTLCVSYPGTVATGASPDAVFGMPGTDPATAGCRNDSRWNPSDATNGLPKGDWCAATNSAATASCHDAWRSESFHTFASFPIKAGTAAP